MNLNFETLKFIETRVFFVNLGNANKIDFDLVILYGVCMFFPHVFVGSSHVCHLCHFLAIMLTGHSKLNIGIIVSVNDRNCLSGAPG